MQHPKPFVVRGLWGVLVVLQSTFFLWDKIQSRKIVALRDGHFFHVFKECGIYAWRAGQEPKILAVVRADKRPLVVFLIQAEYKIIRGKRPENCTLRAAGFEASGIQATAFASLNLPSSVFSNPEFTTVIFPSVRSAYSAVAPTMFFQRCVGNEQFRTSVRCSVVGRVLGQGSGAQGKQQKRLT